MAGSTGVNPTAGSATEAAGAVPIPYRQGLAMTSIYYHARYGPPDDVPEQFRPIPLLEAVKIVKAASGPIAESRRRRAIAKLYTMPARGSDFDEIRAEALDTLGVPLPLFDKSFGKTATTEGKPVSFPIALGFLASTFGGDGLCERTEPKSTSSSDSANIISVRSQLDVNRPLDELRSVVDPQNWDTCGSRYFAEACVPDLDPSGAPVLSSTTRLPTCASTHPDPQGLWNGVLYENFIYTIGGLKLVSFDTVINIRKTENTSTGVLDVAFDLNQSLGGHMLLFPGKCDIDEGGVKLIPKGIDQWRRVEVTKRLRLVFDSEFVTKWMTRLAAATFDDAADSVYESICCRP